MTKFEKAIVPDSERELAIQDHVEAWRRGDPNALALTPAAGEAEVVAQLRATYAAIKAEEQVWKNDLYQVSVREVEAVDGGFPTMLHLSIKRIDRKVIHDWRDLQEIKNRLVGRENEAIELYPAESRRVDTANQYHLWVLKDKGLQFPFGFQDRIVCNSTFGKAVNRPL